MLQNLRRPLKPSSVKAIEPRQNRKRGDDLAEDENVHMVAPDVQKRRLKAAMDDLIGKS